MTALMEAEVASPEPRCSDCGFPVTWQGAEAIAKGSSVREPGEALCNSCSSSRTKLVREVDKIPSTIDQIRARRMAR